MTTGHPQLTSIIHSISHLSPSISHYPPLTFHTTISPSGAAIPVGRTGGLVTDVVCFVAALFLSLVPEWSPHGHGVVH